jgi:hypothetical protein
MDKFDLTYATVDSLSEGVGSSQIAPLMEKLSGQGMKINLITFEKVSPSISISERMSTTGITWTQIPFGKPGPLGGLWRTKKLAQVISDSEITHARSDFPAVAARLNGQSRILWDVRSLWADQRKFIESNPAKRALLTAYAPFENIACNSAIAMSTLTSAIVPILEKRHKNLPLLRTVVPTSVDLQRFGFSQRMPSKLRGLYSGTYNNYYDLELSRRFIFALRQIIDCDVDWAKPKESEVMHLNAGENSSFSVPQPEMANLMADYSFGLSICKENAGPSLKAAMPTKIAEFLAIGRPVVVNAGLGDCDEILSSSGAGIILRRSDNLEDKAIELIEMCKDTLTPTRCREVAIKNFSLDSGVNNYLDIYQCMLS